MASGGQVGESVARRYEALRPYLDERQRRLVLAVEAAQWGRGGLTVVAQVTGVHPDTVAKGVRELEGGGESSGWVRVPGGGRKRASETDPGLAPVLRALLGFGLQANATVTEGRQHADRDAQFGYLNTQISDHLAAGAPAVSVDTTKKGLVGEFHNGGREYQPTGSPVKVNVPDFPDTELGKAIPYGIDDLATNTDWVSVGADHDTSAFAVQTLRRGWNTIGAHRHPDTDRLLICADGGGSHGYRVEPGRSNLPGSPPRPA
jgi:Rhodopirellula transposase DDE domain